MTSALLATLASACRPTSNEVAQASRADGGQKFRNGADFGLRPARHRGQADFRPGGAEVSTIFAPLTSALGR